MSRNLPRFDDLPELEPERSRELKRRKEVTKAIGLKYLEEHGEVLMDKKSPEMEVRRRIGIRRVHTKFIEEEKSDEI